MKQLNPLFKTLFLFFFVLLLFTYLFLDDGGISTKTWYDIVFVPIPSALVGLLLTLVFYPLIIGLRWIISTLIVYPLVTGLNWIAERLA